MSMSALRTAREITSITPTQKLVLYVLADMANEAGECWPSVAAIAAASCLGERAIQGALRGLLTAGIVALQPGGGRGRTTCYRVVNPAANAGKGAPDAPNGDAETPQENPERVHLVPETPHLTTETPQQMHPESNEAIRSQRKRGVARSRATQLPDDWRPVEANAAYCRERGLHLRDTFEAFRDHHRARGTSYRDWDAAWRTWCRNEVKFAARRAPAARSKPKTAFDLLAEMEADEDERGRPSPRHVQSVVLQ